MFPLENALKLFEAPSIPTFAETEEEIDPYSYDPAKESETPPDYPGNGLAQHPMLIIGEGCNKMFLVKNGRVIWTFCTGKGWEYDDIWMMSDGNILFTRMYWAAIVTPSKEYLWRYNAPKDCEIHTIQPIGLHKIMLVINAPVLPIVKIINPENNTVEYEHTIPYDVNATVHGQFRRMRYTSNNTFLASCLSMGCVIEYDLNFNEIWRYEIPGPWAAIRLKNGNTLITGEKEGVHREVNSKGETVWEIRLEDLPERYRLNGSQSAVRLDNGNTLLCSRGIPGKTPQIVEVNPQKEVVWVLKDWKNIGPVTAVQVLDEAGIPECPGALER